MEYWFRRFEDLRMLWDRSEDLRTPTEQESSRHVLVWESDSEKVREVYGENGHKPPTDYGPRHETSAWFRGLPVSSYFDQYLVNISTGRFGSNGSSVQVIKFLISFSFS